MLSPLRELNLTVTHGADTIDSRNIQINMVSEWLNTDTSNIPVKRIAQTLHTKFISYILIQSRNNESGVVRKSPRIGGVKDSYASDMTTRWNQVFEVVKHYLF